MTNEVIKLHTESPIWEEHLGFEGCKGSCREVAVMKLPLEFSHQQPCACVRIWPWQCRLSLHPHTIVWSGPLPLPLKGQALCGCAVNRVPALVFLCAPIRSCLVQCLMQSLMKFPYHPAGIPSAALNVPRVMSSICIPGMSFLLLGGPEKAWKDTYICLLYTFPSQREMNELDQICQNPHRMF